MKSSMQLNDATFARFSAWMREQSGMHMPESKKTLLQQRLLNRLTARQVSTYEAYLRLLQDPDEVQEQAIAVDLLTTHETFFFRERKHFDWMQHEVAARPKNSSLNVWSAASSTGEEIWSLAMILAHQLGEQANWHVLGSDISLRVIAQAKAAHYSLNRVDGIPSVLMRKYCLKGVGKQDGSLLIVPALRNKVEFRVINLALPLPEIGLFDFIFLRNVLIYFDVNGKQDILNKVIKKLKSNAYLFVSHSESLYGLSEDLKLIQPGIYQYKSVVAA